jgi:hypothetical protein
MAMAQTAVASIGREAIMPSGRTELGRTTGYDNVSVGNAISSKERTISGALPPAKLIGGGEGPAGANAVGISLPAVAGSWPVATANIQDNISVGNITPVTENVKVGG